MLVVEPNENRIVDANRAGCRLLGYDRELLRSLKFTDLHPGQRPARQRGRARAGRPVAVCPGREPER